MNEQCRIFLMSRRQGFQKVEPIVILGVGKELSCPLDVSPQGLRVTMNIVLADGSLDIALQMNCRKPERNLQAFDRLGAVADRVAENEKLVHKLTVNVVEHSSKCFKIAVNIAEDGPHWSQAVAEC